MIPHVFIIVLIGLAVGYILDDDGFMDWLEESDRQIAAIERSGLDEE